MSKLSTDDFVRKYDSRINLAKDRLSSVGLAEQKAKVVIAIDISFSMQKLFMKGIVQKTFDRILPLTMHLDNTEAIDVWLFNHETYNHSEPFTLDNRNDFIRREIIMKYDFGGTKYSPVIQQISKKYVDSGKNSPPVLVLFFTDGDSSDRKDTEDDLKIASIRGIFWKFIGINSNTSFFEKLSIFFCKLFRINRRPVGFGFLQKLDRMSGRKVDNANFIHIDDLKNIKDDELYRRLLEEFPYWLNQAKEMKIVT